MHCSSGSLFGHGADSFMVALGWGGPDPTFEAFDGTIVCVAIGFLVEALFTTRRTEVIRFALILALSRGFCSSTCMPQTGPLPYDSPFGGRERMEHEQPIAPSVRGRFYLGPPCIMPPIPCIFSIMFIILPHIVICSFIWPRCFWLWSRADLILAGSFDCLAPSMTLVI